MEKIELARIAGDTLRDLRYLIEEQHAWSAGEMEDQSPFGDFLDGVLSIDRVVKQPLFGDGETLLHWEVLLALGGPTVRLEIDETGSGRVVVAWWSAPYHLAFDGVLRELGEELSAYDEAFFGG